VGEGRAQANDSVYYCGENSTTPMYWSCPKGLPRVTEAMTALANASLVVETHVARVTSRFHSSFDVLSVFLLACALLLLVLVITGMLGSITRSQVSSLSAFPLPPDNVQLGTEAVVLALTRGVVWGHTESAGDAVLAGSAGDGGYVGAGGVSVQLCGVSVRPM